MSEEWKINRLESGGIEGWVSLYKSHPMSPFAYCHEDEAEEIVALRNEISRLLDEKSTESAFAEGVDQHVSDMLEAMRPFVDALKADEPLRKISFYHWHKLSKVYDYAIECLRQPPEKP